MSKDLITLERTCPITAGLLRNFNVVPATKRISTIYVSDGNIHVPVKYYLNKSAQERLYILAKTVWNIALQHKERGKGKQAEIWRQACEHEVNDILMHRGFLLPKKKIYFPDMTGYTAEEVYENLLLNKQNAGGDGDSERDGGDDDSDDADCSAGDSDQNEDVDMGDLPVSEFVVNQDASSDMSEVLSEIQSMVGQEYSQGNLPAMLKRIFNGSAKTKTDWREALRDFICSFQKAGYTWFPPNRRYVSQKKYLPSRSRKPVLEINLALDTSGSCADFLERFLSEIISIAETYPSYRVTVFQCDCMLDDEVVTYTEHEPLDPAKFIFTGGGGTDFRPVFEKINQDIETEMEEPLPLIFFTDGEGPAPNNEPEYPVLWAIVGGGIKPSDWGLEIKIDNLENPLS